MSITLISHGSNTGAYLGNPDGADRTVVTINTVGANFIFVAYCAGGLSGDGNPLGDSKGNTWTTSPGGPFHGGYWSVGVHWCVNPTTDAAHVFTTTTPNPAQPQAAMVVSAWNLGTLTGDPFNTVVWNPTGATGDPRVIGPVPVTANSLQISLFAMGGHPNPVSGDGRGHVEAPWTQIDMVEATGTGFACPTCHQGLNQAWHVSGVAGTETVSWDYDTPNDVDAGMWVFTSGTTVVVTPPPAPQTFLIRRLRRFMLPWDDAGRQKFLSRLEVVLQTGIGDATTPDPQIMCRLSTNGGVTWGPERLMRVGPRGAFRTRAKLRRLGEGRNWVVELTMTDPVDWQLVEVLADLSEGAF